jgi:hypothetical protein
MIHKSTIYLPKFRKKMEKGEGAQLDLVWQAAASPQDH